MVDWDKHLPSILAWGGSFLTGIFTLLGVWLANRSSFRQLIAKLQHETNRETREALRHRLEELYSLVGLWGNEMSMHYLPYLRVMDGHLTYNEALDITLNHKSSVDANRMFTLAKLYSPSSHGALDKMISCRDKAATVHAEFKKLYRTNGEPSKGHAKLLQNVLLEFDEAIEQYRAELGTYAKNV